MPPQTNPAPAPQPSMPTPANVPPNPPGNKKPILMWVLIGLGILAVVVIVWFLWSNSLKQKNQKIAELNDQYAQLQKTNEELSAGIKDGTARIPELKLQYPINDTTQKMVYIIDTKDSERPVMLLSTKPLMLSQLAASKLSPPPQRNACGAAEGAAGTISGFNTGDTFNGKPVETIQNAQTRKIGDVYWIYQNPPVTCSTNQSVQDEQKKAVDQAQVFFKSLEAIK